MNKKIYKYELVIIDNQIINLPTNFNLLSAQSQRGHIFVWVLVNVDSPLERTKFSIYGIGHPIPDDPGNYIDTVKVGPMVWHIFHS